MNAAVLTVGVAGSYVSQPGTALLALALAFALTAAVEGVIILLLTGRMRCLLYSLLCNLLTNPALNLTLWLASSVYGEAVRLPLLLALELAAVLTEAAVYRLLCRWSFGRALLVSAALNLASFLAGVLLLGSV